MRYLAKIKYLGTDFHGFQVQPDQRTVQGTLCEALRAALGVEVRVTGCSRTDSGVHANEFCILIDAPGATVPPTKLPVALCRFLPPDLSLFYAESASDDFHPRYDVVSKEYLYRIKNSKINDPFDFGRVWILPRKITDDGFEKIKKAAEYFVGKKDFSAFMSEGSDVVDTVRNVFYLDVEKNGEYIDFRICADGFLYNMVRIIVGTLLAVGFDNIRVEDIEKIIASGNRSLAGQTAPPEGLYLNKVNY